MNKDKIVLQIIIFASLSAIISGALYLYREWYLELNSIESAIYRVSRMFLIYIFFPFIWVIYWKKETLKDMGITKKNLLISTILGIAVYSIALAVFIFSIGNPSFNENFVSGIKETNINELIFITILVSIMAMITDLWTRGFILMLLAKHSSVYFAILTQNITWFLIHIYEIDLLKDAITLQGAIALTLTLGIFGDIVSLKIKNVIGVGIGHIWLNAVFTAYIYLM